MSSAKPKLVKCVVWDLDCTLWDGNLLEDSHVQLRPGAREIVRALDKRGILQSIASRNDYETALTRLREFELADYFLYPQIGWNTKSSSIRTIAAKLNIGLDTFAFIDDQPFERDEVRGSIPEVLCIDAADLTTLLVRPEMIPKFINEDTHLRRLMYLQDSIREKAEMEFNGPAQEFLASLGIRLQIYPACQDDLQRAEELTVRTNQLNTTGYTYSYDELDHFRTSKNHILLMASSSDKYGTYGKIGLALIEKGPQCWTLKLLLMSCRVMSRGIGSPMLNWITKQAWQAGAIMKAEFVPNGRNRMMYITYKLANFKEVEKRGELIVLGHDGSTIPDPPPYIQVEARQTTTDAS